MKKIIILLFSLFILTGCQEKEIELVCEQGELKDNKCVVVETMNVVLKCREGYTFKEEIKKCFNSMTIAAKKVSECPDGFYIGSDNWCYSDIVYDKVTKLNCTSPNIVAGDTLSSVYEKDGACYEKICTKKSVDGKNCLEFKETKLDIKGEVVCPDGTKSVKGECRKYYWMSKDYSCEMGKLVGRNCIIEDSIDKEPYCEVEGYTLNNDKTMCEKYTYYVPVEKYIE